MAEVVQSSVYVGVDTPADIHHRALVDPLGRGLADRTFPTTAAGYEQVVRWCAQFGDVAAVGVEGTSSYGAALKRRLREAGISVVEVDRPGRKSRRLPAKTDALDTYSAARVVAAGRATAVPKRKEGLVESIRCLHVAHRSAVKARTQAINEICGMLNHRPFTAAWAGHQVLTRVAHHPGDRLAYRVAAP
jgi:transposase